jgi:poly[(R)-3-hydroxyalkanoate] polymerase subunit PhaC
MIDTPLADFHKQFAVSDLLRRAQGDIAGIFGLNPRECPHQIVMSGGYWRLRDYGGSNRAQPLLIIAAPIKQPYIWDLAPPISAITLCLRHDLHVYLLEWMPASAHTGSVGLEEDVFAIVQAVAAIMNKADGRKPCVIGHSLGGTLAAIYGSFRPESIRGLILLDAPLCFEPAKSYFRDALISLVPDQISDQHPFPGSLLSHASALASPQTFIWSRLADAVMSITDPQAMEVHARVERWALDEVALPGKLVHQIVDWLYRENRFCRGELNLNDKVVGPSTLSIRTLVVVNTSDEVAPLVSVKPFTDRMAGTVRIIEYTGEIGVCLQHLGILIGPNAQAAVWPQIVSWLNS